ncbi:hypothetical protein BT96DRAFT_999037 [Gymnopus androsaceus JB14]|uniref:Uncharacterized protein n=1 Tax=Gymnopus androsaceus JB14 TaxID=1447944 RepID=A0A6A4H9F7_9AGAR|nr:hypothetical protein BT96DRAFT_999037 [Gymnopus androsaceus JB14]
MSSPIRALNILFRPPIPIPSLFDGPNDLPTNLLRRASPTSDNNVKWSHEYKRGGSASVTVVQGRRSGDIWLAQGDAIDVLPIEEPDDDPTTPPLPIQDEDSSLPVDLHSRSYSETSAQFGRIRKNSKVSSYFSGVDESLAFASKIMIAQKHYFALAQTIQVNGSEGIFRLALICSINRASQHLRTRSVTSVRGPQTPTSGSFDLNPSPPPAIPLSPTPPNFSSGDDMNEIDALTAGVLPLLVPGLKVRDDMKARNCAREELELSQERSWSTNRTGGEGKTARFGLPRALNELGGEPWPQDFCSLGLGKNGIQFWKYWNNEVGRAIENKFGQYTALPSNVEFCRNTVFGTDSIPNDLSNLRGTLEEAATLCCSSTRSLDLRAEVTHGLDTARFSIACMINRLPASAASTTTLFEEYADGLESGPQAENAPHNTVPHKRASEDVVPFHHCLRPVIIECRPLRTNSEIQPI